MRSSTILNPCVAGLAAVTVSLLAMAGGTPALGGDHYSQSLVAELAGSADLEPISVVEQAPVDLTAAAARGSKASSFARQSVPARDRSTAYRGGELFRNTKVAVPLLVADLEPRVASGIRPMSGRSVGARPAASWTKPTTVAPAAGTRTDSPARASAAWSSFGQR